MDGTDCRQSATIGDFISVIDKRSPERERLLREIDRIHLGASVAGFATVSDWAAHARTSGCTAILYNTGGRSVTEASVAADIAGLVTATRAPVLLLSPFEDLEEMIAALEMGAMGYVPASLGAEAIPSAIALTRMSVVFLPVRTLLAMRGSGAEDRKLPESAPRLTARQSAVAEALRRGKPNKLIAYELEMGESTVKFHIRNIMKKVGARNRTEAGYKLNAFLPGPSAASEVA